MHAAERETIIAGLIAAKGFVSFRELERVLDGSPATIRRDLERMAGEGKLIRVRGGAKYFDTLIANPITPQLHLAGVPFHENVGRHRGAKSAIGKAAADLCEAGQGVMIDGGSTTLQMCPHLAELNLQVLTNSLHIVSALINQVGTRVLVPSGAVFPEQSIILSVFGDDGMPRFHAPKLFMGAASVGPLGIMQLDIILVASNRRFIDRAEEVIVLVDSSKFTAPSGHVVCALDQIDVIITDSGVTPETVNMLQNAGLRVIIAD
jgi:DeoR family transcriptional regulator, ulaG and ulaABCDEF operon transcriptional repressor